MPIHSGQATDKKMINLGKTRYYQWGKSGKKYYYNPKLKRSKDYAYKKALKQSIAIRANGYKGY